MKKIPWPKPCWGGKALCHLPSFSPSQKEVKTGNEARNPETKLSQKQMGNAVCWLVPHGTCSVYFLVQPRDASIPNRLVPLTTSLIKKITNTLAYLASLWMHFLTGIPSSQMTQACVMLRKKKSTHPTPHYISFTESYSTAVQSSCSCCTTKSHHSSFFCISVIDRHVGI